MKNEKLVVVEGSVAEDTIKLIHIWLNDQELKTCWKFYIPEVHCFFTQ